MNYILLPGIASFFLTALSVPLFISFFKKHRAGQSIREDGPKAHLSKSGTPTMGGLAMIFSVLIVCLFGKPSGEMFTMLFGLLFFGMIGFADDYIKVLKKRNLGLTAAQKILLQLAAAFFISFEASKTGTSVFIPFAGRFCDFGPFYIPFTAFVFLAMSNSVNLTDGLDGLAAGVTSAVSLALVLASCVLGGMGRRDVSFFTAALCGACLGFLIYNKHPAKLFMGDTGSMALGGALAAAAAVGGLHLLLPIAGAVYVAEALSVMIQVVVFKTQNGRRFFRMAPLHHHFELGGMAEEKVTKYFVFASFLFSAMALLGVMVK